MVTSEEAIYHASETPDIDAAVVWNLEENFGRDVRNGPDNAFTLVIARQLDCVGETRNLGAEAGLIVVD